MKAIKILFLCFLLNACSNQIDIPSEMKLCEMDTDCILIQPDCSDCEFESINKKFINVFLENKKQYCNENKPNLMCNSIVSGEIKCINNICILE